MAGLLLAGLVALWLIALPGSLAGATVLLVALLLGGLVVVARINHARPVDGDSLSRQVHERGRTGEVLARSPAPPHKG